MKLGKSYFLLNSLPSLLVLLCDKLPRVTLATEPEGRTSKKEKDRSIPVSCKTQDPRSFKMEVFSSPLFNDPNVELANETLEGGYPTCEFYTTCCPEKIDKVCERDIPIP